MSSGSPDSVDRLIPRNSPSQAVRARGWVNAASPMIKSRFRTFE